jgi:endogenous inhibitor of DNA gyrase (YacG/DUF329 family)
MNAEMARQITELRHKGLGYKSIAIVVGTSRENVRYYCKTHGLDGYAEQVKMQYIEQRNIPDNCKYCGKHLVRKPHSGKKLFCSDECRRAWWKQHPEKSMHSQEATYTFECAYCKRYFSAYGNKFRKYCSHDCYVMDRFWKNGNLNHVVPKSKIRAGIKDIVLES